MPSFRAMPLLGKPSRLQYDSQVDWMSLSSKCSVKGAGNASIACMKWRRCRRHFSVLHAPPTYASSVIYSATFRPRYFQSTLDSHARPCRERRTRLLCQHQRRAPGYHTSCRTECDNVRAPASAPAVDTRGCACGDSSGQRRTAGARLLGGSPSSWPISSGQNSSSRGAGG